MSCGVGPAGVLAGLFAAALGCAPVYSESTPPLAAVTVPRSSRSSDLRAEPSAGAAADLDLVRALQSLVWPLATDGSGILSSVYGERLHPLGGDPRFHAGLDLRARAGTPVYAAAAGIVATSASSGAYGNFVILEHGGGLRTVYAHHRENLVRSGDRVRRGQPIGLVGRSGNATGDHLHFEVRWKDGTVDPRTVLPLLDGRGPLMGGIR
ncbi:MAG TPA: M23 family metallopeptidase [Gemmatimonadota bacterium]|nr:M23 family metallopeptidase [Gemmatimonadota bacterium]